MPDLEETAILQAEDWLGDLYDDEGDITTSVEVIVDEMKTIHGLEYCKQAKQWRRKNDRN